jgi:hypothetical protein
MDWKIAFIILAGYSSILILVFIIATAYYRVKFVNGTKNKFRRQIQEILERKNIVDIGLEEDLTELLSGEKVFKECEK